MDREYNIRAWLKAILGSSDFQIQPLTNDASFRRYFRVVFKEHSWVLMDAPPPEAPERFVAVAEMLEKEGLSVPSIKASNLEEGFLLLSDLGDRVYLNELVDSTADELYDQALRALRPLQRCKAPLPYFTEAFLKGQIDIFEHWYLEKHQKIENLEPIQKKLAPMYELLYRTIQAQPQVFVHRDYHSRNLMILENNSPGILDFQDAMIGPITYDLVSLLQDCYIAWPREKIEAWVFAFQQACVQEGLLDAEVSQEEFLRWFDWTGLHRHLKNLGVFSRLHYRDQKSHYLKDIPQLYRYIFETTERYPALLPLKAFFDDLLEKETFA